MFEFADSLVLMIYPLGLGLGLSCLALSLLLCHRRRAGLAALFSGTILLWSLLTPLAADRLHGALERDWPQVPVEALPHADAVLVLGGAFNTGNGQFLYPQAGGQVNRYWHAARLYRAGRAPRIILSGGREPHRSAGMTEAEAGAVFLQELGVPREAILLETRALTTRGHAEQLGPILEQHGVGSLLVVTSAVHMQRAMHALATLDVDLQAAATDYATFDEPGFRLRRLLPSSNGLSRSTRALHEIIGMHYYRAMGWVSEPARSAPFTREQGKGE